MSYFKLWIAKHRYHKALRLEAVANHRKWTKNTEARLRKSDPSS